MDESHDNDWQDLFQSCIGTTFLKPEVLLERNLFNEEYLSK